MPVKTMQEKDLKSILFATLDDFLNERISEFEAKTVSKLVVEYRRASKNQVKSAQLTIIEEKK